MANPRVLTVTRKLPESVQKEISDLLVDAFRGGDITLLVSDHLKVRLETITAPDATPRMAARVVAWCVEHDGKVESLLNGMVEERPYIGHFIYRWAAQECLILA